MSSFTTTSCGSGPAADPPTWPPSATPHSTSSSRYPTRPASRSAARPSAGTTITSSPHSLSRTDELQAIPLPPPCRKPRTWRRPGHGIFSGAAPSVELPDFIRPVALDRSQIAVHPVDPARAQPVGPAELGRVALEQPGDDPVNLAPGLGQPHPHR